MRMMIPGSPDEQSSKNTDRVQKILEAGKSLYLVNTTDQISERHSRGIIYIDYVDSRGNLKHVNFPDSYLPICITDRIPAEKLVDNPSFWSYVSSGALTPVPPKRARKMLQAPEAEEERNRLRRRTGHTLDKPGRTISHRVKPSGQHHFDLHHPDDKGQTEDGQEAAPELNRKMMTVIAQLQEGQMSEGVAMAEIRSIGSGLSREDLGYLVGNGTLPDGSSKITDFAMEQLNSGNRPSA